MGECQSACNFDLTKEARQQIDTSIRIEYTGSRFIIPDVITFEKQTTFTKVEAAAKQFCQKNNISTFYVSLLTRIIAYRHQHVFQQIWNRLGVDERDEFLSDLSAIEHDLMDSFYHHFVEKKSKDNRKEVSIMKLAPPRVTKEPQISLNEKTELKNVGEHLLKSNKVAAIFLCAGSSSRFDNEDKFLAPINLYEKVTILDIVFKRLQRNARGNTSLPIIVNCNEFNIEKIEKYLKAKNYYGFKAQKFRFFITYSLAVFDSHGQYCLNEKMKLIKRPSGTAAGAEYLLNPLINNFLVTQGVQYVYFSGMQNLMENPCDPILLGMIKTEKGKIAAKCVNPVFYGEKLHRYYASPDSQTIQVINPQDFKQLQSTEALCHLPVAINSMVFELQSLRQIMASYNDSLFLAQKYHVIAKQQKVYSVKFFRAEIHNCYSFEKDLLDIISCVKKPILYKVARRSNYAPICSKNKQYALSEAVQFFQLPIQQQLDAIIMSSL